MLESLRFVTELWNSPSDINPIVLLLTMQRTSNNFKCHISKELELET